MKLININNIDMCRPQPRGGGVGRLIFADCRLCFKDIKNYKEWCTYIERGLVVITQELIADKPKPGGINKQISDCEGSRTIGYEFSLNVQDYNGLIDFIDYKFWNEILNYPERYKLGFLTCENHFYGFVDRFVAEGGYVIEKFQEDLSYWDIVFKWRGYREEPPVVLNDLIRYFKELCKTSTLPKGECCPLLLKLAPNSRVNYNASRRGYEVRVQLQRQRSVSGAPCLKYKNVSLCFMFGSRCTPIDTGGVLPGDNARDITNLYLDIFLSDSDLQGAGIDLSRPNNIDIKVKYECEGVNFKYESLGPTLLVGRGSENADCCPVFVEKQNEGRYFESDDTYRMDVLIARQISSNGCKPLTKLALRLLVSTDLTLNQWSSNSPFIQSDAITPFINPNNLGTVHTISISRAQILNILGVSEPYEQPIRIGLVLVYQCEGDVEETLQPLVYNFGANRQRVCCPLKLSYNGLGNYSSAKYLLYDGRDSVLNTGVHNANLRIEVLNPNGDVCKDYKNVRLKAQFYLENFRTNEFEPIGSPFDLKEKVSNDPNFPPDRFPYLGGNFPSASDTVSPSNLEGLYVHKIPDCGDNLSLSIPLIELFSASTLIPNATLIEYLIAIVDQGPFYITLDNGRRIEVSYNNPRGFIELVTILHGANFFPAALGIKYILEYHCVDDDNNLPPRISETPIRRLPKVICCGFDCKVEWNYDADKEEYVYEFRIVRPQEYYSNVLPPSVTLQQWENFGMVCDRAKLFAYQLHGIFDGVTSYISGFNVVEITDIVNGLSAGQSHVITGRIKRRDLYDRADSEIRRFPYDRYRTIELGISRALSCCFTREQLSNNGELKLAKSPFDCSFVLEDIPNPSCCSVDLICNTNADVTNFTSCFQFNRGSYFYSFRARVNAPNNCLLATKLGITVRFQREGFVEFTNRSWDLVFTTPPRLPLQNGDIYLLEGIIPLSEIEDALPANQKNLRETASLLGEFTVDIGDSCSKSVSLKLIEPKQERPYFCCPMVLSIDSGGPTIDFSEAEQLGQPVRKRLRLSSRPLPNGRCGRYYDYRWTYSIRHKVTQVEVSRGSLPITSILTLPNPMPVTDLDLFVPFSLTRQDLCLFSGFGSICNSEELNNYEMIITVSWKCDTAGVAQDYSASTEPMPFSWAACCPPKLRNTDSPLLPLKNITFVQDSSGTDGIYTGEYVIYSEGVNCRAITEYTVYARFALKGNNPHTSSLSYNVITKVVSTVPGPNPLVDTFIFSIRRSEIFNYILPSVPVEQRDNVEFTVALYAKAKCGSEVVELRGQDYRLLLEGVPATPLPCCPVDLGLGTNHTIFNNDGELVIDIKNVSFSRGGDCAPITDLKLLMTIVLRRTRGGEDIYPDILATADMLNIGLSQYDGQTNFSGSFNLTIPQSRLLELIQKPNLNGYDRIQINLLMVAECGNEVVYSNGTINLYEFPCNSSSNEVKLTCLPPNLRFRHNILVAPNTAPITNVQCVIEFQIGIFENNNYTISTISSIVSLSDLISDTNEFGSTVNPNIQPYNFPLSHNESANANKGLILSLDYRENGYFDRALKNNGFPLGIKDSRLKEALIRNIKFIRTCLTGSVVERILDENFHKHYYGRKLHGYLKNGHLRVNNIVRNHVPNTPFDFYGPNYQSDNGTLVANSVVYNNNQALAWTFGLHLGRVNIPVNGEVYLFHLASHRIASNPYSWLWMKLIRVSSSNYSIEISYAHNIFPNSTDPTVEHNHLRWNNVINVSGGWENSDEVHHIAFTFRKPAGVSPAGPSVIRLGIDGVFQGAGTAVNVTPVGLPIMMNQAALNSDIVIGGRFEDYNNPPNNAWMVNPDPFSFHFDNIVLFNKAVDAAQLKEISDNYYYTLASENRVVFAHLLNQGLVNNPSDVWTLEVTNCFPGGNFTDLGHYRLRRVHYVQPYVTPSQATLASNLGGMDSSFFMPENLNHNNSPTI